MAPLIMPPLLIYHVEDNERHIKMNYAIGMIVIKYWHMTAL